MSDEQGLKEAGTEVPLTLAQERLRVLFDGMAPIVWQDEKSKEAWLDAQIKHALAVADSDFTSDPLVAFNAYARALGMLILANQLGGG